MALALKEREEPKKGPSVRVVIVGADGLKWSEEGEEKAKEIIKTILKQIEQGWIVTSWVGTLPNTRKSIDRPEEIIVVSGHCPVGEELYYCTTCDRWIPHEEWLADDFMFTHTHKNHKMVKVHKEGGIDTWVEIIATRLGVKTEIYPALCTKKGFDGFTTKDCFRHLDSCGQPTGYHMWDYHFKPRNFQMAKIGNIVIDIEPAGSCKYCKGSGLVGVPIFNDFGEPDGISGEPCKKCEGDGAYSGGTWTWKEARKRGKEVHKIIIN